MLESHESARRGIHCRIGSSESYARQDHVHPTIHCRIGSSEIDQLERLYGLQIHCCTR
ncbi:hypothetical protein [Malikia spinosa]|uniref:hypothetical protein n=1 Tax=Malikia spinosa TaxID=86180 RepID=UPI003A5221CA